MISEVQQQKFETMVLEKLKLGIRQSVIPEMLGQTELRWCAYGMGDVLACNLVAFVTANKYASGTIPVTFQSPATWWDHFKQAKFPEWALRRWPVKVKTERQEVQLDQYVLYPGYVLPDRGPHYAHFQARRLTP